MASAGESTTSQTSSSAGGGTGTAGAATPTQPIVTPPLASASTFELYDPRGLLTRRRSQSRSSNAAASPGAERGTPSTSTVPARDRKDSTATQSSLSSVVEDDGAHDHDVPIPLVGFCLEKSL